MRWGVASGIVQLLEKRCKFAEITNEFAEITNEFAEITNALASKNRRHRHDCNNLASRQRNAPFSGQETLLRSGLVHSPAEGRQPPLPALTDRFP